MRLLARAALLSAAVAAFAASALADSPRRVRYEGITDQEEKVSLAVKDDARGVRYEISYRMPCNGAEPAESTAFSTRSDRIRPGSEGRFRHTFEQHETFADGTPYRLTSELSGKLGKRRARGTYRGTLTYTSPDTGQAVDCDSGTVGWTARRP